MKRIREFVYEVIKNERIELSVTAIGIPPMITAMLDDRPIMPLDQRIISFEITKEHHRLHLYFGFPASRSDASYEVSVVGSFGDESDSFEVKAENPHRLLVLVFRVGDTGPK